jgi:hypothetical protein
MVWYHAENEEPWKITAVKEIATNEWVFHGKNEFYVNCHVQEIPGRFRLMNYFLLIIENFQKMELM